MFLYQRIENYKMTTQQFILFLHFRVMIRLICDNFEAILPKTCVIFIFAKELIYCAWAGDQNQIPGQFEEGRIAFLFHFFNAGVELIEDYPVHYLFGLFMEFLFCSEIMSHFIFKQFAKLTP